MQFNYRHNQWNGTNEPKETFFTEFGEGQRMFEELTLSGVLSEFLSSNDPNLVLQRMTATLSRRGARDEWVEITKRTFEYPLA